jgi:hypothetical protein
MLLHTDYEIVDLSTATKIRDAHARIFKIEVKSADVDEFIKFLNSHFGKK